MTKAIATDRTNSRSYAPHKLQDRSKPWIANITACLKATAPSKTPHPKHHTQNPQPSQTNVNLNKKPSPLPQKAPDRPPSTQPSPPGTGPPQPCGLPNTRHNPPSHTMPLGHHKLSLSLSPRARVFPSKVGFCTDTTHALHFLSLSLVCPSFHPPDGPARLLLSTFFATGVNFRFFFSFPFSILRSVLQPGQSHAAI